MHYSRTKWPENLIRLLNCFCHACCGVLTASRFRGAALDFYRTRQQGSTMDSMNRNARIEAAKADLESGVCTNYCEAGRKWNVDRSTLSKRHRGKTGTIEEAVFSTRKKLSNTQEGALIEHINKLTNRGI